MEGRQVHHRFQPCDDSTPQAGTWDSTTCSANANAYAQDPSVIANIGTFNSGCAELEVPVLNQAQPGPIAMVSPANTWPGLTQGTKVPAEPSKYYPTTTRNYARVVAPDNFQGPALAQTAQGLGVKSVYILNDKQAYGAGVATYFEDAAKKLGIKVARQLGLQHEDRHQLPGPLPGHRSEAPRRDHGRRPHLRERRPADQGQGRGARRQPAR